jgi:hypothetical protein
VQVRWCSKVAKHHTGVCAGRSSIYALAPALVRCAWVPCTPHGIPVCCVGRHAMSKCNFAGLCSYAVHVAASARFFCDSKRVTRSLPAVTAMPLLQCGATLVPRTMQWPTKHADTRPVNIWRLLLLLLLCLHCNLGAKNHAVVPPDLLSLHVATHCLNANATVAAVLSCAVQPGRQEPRGGAARC